MRTANLDLPLVQPSQAQKHVTVNEALAVLDGICQLTLQSISIAAPPVDAAEGEAYGVPAGASGAWSGAAGQIAILSNGGWRFVTPALGWRASVRDAGFAALWDGAEWRGGALAVSAGGAASLGLIVEADVVLSPGATAAGPAIPARSTVFAVTGVVTDAVTGSLATWRLGTADDPGRYGTGLGRSAGSWVEGLSGAPQAYYADTDLVLSADGGDFAGGTVRLAIHAMRFARPRP